MVPRQTLVQKKCCHVGGGIGGGVPYRRIKDPGTRAIDGTYVVMCGGRCPGDFRLRANFQQRTRPSGKKFIQCWLHALLDLAIGFDDFFLRFERRQQRVTHQRRKKGIQVSTEPDLRAYLLHLAANSCHLAQTQLVYLRGCHRCGGLFTHFECVLGSTIGCCAQPGCVDTFGQVLVSDEAVQFDDRRRDFLFHRLAVRRGQADAICITKCRREIFYRHIKPARNRITHHLRLQLGQHSCHQHLRQHHTFRHALAHVHDCRIHPLRKPV